MTKIKLIDGSGIYAFQNKTNGKIYVGQSRQVLTRKRQHERGDTSNSRRFHNAMKKYGPDNFDFIVLEYCDERLLDDREVYWVMKLNSLFPDGYNLTSGGGAFRKHHAETRKIMSLNQRQRIASGEHVFSSTDFQRANSYRQRDLADKGLHPSQQVEVKEKRSGTVRRLIATTGKFFTHSQEEIERKRAEQNALYAEGKGRFQDPIFIEQNRQLVQKKLADGTHFSQHDGWSEQARNASRPLMKQVILAIRTPDGKTIQRKFESINQAVRELNCRKQGVSKISRRPPSVLSVKCQDGLIIKGIVGERPDWDLSQLKLISTSEFQRMVSIEVTILLSSGERFKKMFSSIREASRELVADKSAIRSIMNDGSYKSTGCTLGRIIKVEKVD
jgi:group I intron endonuclease